MQESNKVFEIETLSSETFVTPVGSDALGVGNAGVLGIGYSPDTVTGKVTCSVPFSRYRFALQGTPLAEL